MGDVEYGARPCECGEKDALAALAYLSCVNFKLNVVPTHASVGSGDNSWPMQFSGTCSWHVGDGLDRLPTAVTLAILLMKIIAVNFRLSPRLQTHYT